MDNILLLNTNKTNIFEFDAEVQGVDNSKPIVVRLIMHIEDIMYGFLAKKEKENGNKYVVEVPPLPHLPKSTFNFTVEIVVDGYLFEGAKGVVNISGDPLAHVTAPTVKIKEEPKEEKEKKEDKKKEVDKKIKESSLPTRPREKSIEQLANEIMSVKSADLTPNKNITTETIVSKETTNSEDNIKTKEHTVSADVEEKVKKILESTMGKLNSQKNIIKKGNIVER